MTKANLEAQALSIAQCEQIHAEDGAWRTSAQRLNRGTDLIAVSAHSLLICAELFSGKRYIIGISLGARLRATKMLQ
jgi:hypothetical protein